MLLYMLLNIVGPNEMMKYVIEAKRTLDAGVKFSNQITPEIFELAKLSYKFLGKRTLAVEV